MAIDGYNMMGFKLIMCFTDDMCSLISSLARLKIIKSLHSSLRHSYRHMDRKPRIPMSARKVAISVHYVALQVILVSDS